MAAQLPQAALLELELISLTAAVAQLERLAAQEHSAQEAVLVVAAELVE